MNNISKAKWEIKNQKVGQKIGIMFFVLCLVLSVLIKNIPIQLQIGMLLSISGMMILKLRRRW